MISGLLIREARRRKHLTQAQLAARLGTTQSAVARWESGRTAPALETVMNAVRACGLDLHLSLAERDLDHDRLISDSLRMPPSQRLGALLRRLEVEGQLRAATPVP